MGRTDKKNTARMKKEILHNILNVFVWLIFIGVIGVFLGFAEEKRKAIICNQIQVDIMDSTGAYFVEPKDIESMLKQRAQPILGFKSEALPLEKIEKQIKNIPSIRETQVYTTLDGVLHILVYQRNPIIRIVNRENDSYYIDNEGVFFPLSDKYSAHVTIASGELRESYAIRYKHNAKLINDSTFDSPHYFTDDLFTLAKFLHTDSFYKSFIEQVYINKNKEIELIPKMGTFTILLGDITNLEDKFTNLSAFIRLALPRTGWDTYSIINLKYKNQIVCTKKCKYEPVQ
jgi:cell division protein FtsQ